MRPPARHFVDVGTRLVHYRRQGEGPAVVLLHGSPNSSESLEPLIAVLAESFTAIALDTPGNGLSSPLAHEDPETSDYAAALGETLDALQLGRVALYGFHTGAGTAAEFAGRHPERVTALVLDGYAAWTEDEKTKILPGYLPRFEPRLDGSHMAWLWARVMEQSMFFPWHRPSPVTRMTYDMAPPEGLHRTALEFLRSGDHYRKPYQAALRGDGAARARRLKSPALITAHSMDPIAHHLDRLGDLPPCVTVARTEADRPAMFGRFLRWLSDFPADGAPPPPHARNIGFVPTRLGPLRWRGNIGGAVGPLVLLPGLGASADAAMPAPGEAAPGRPLIAIDLPGHGESPLAPAAEFAFVEDLADAMADALQALSLDRPAVAGWSLGGQIAAELAARGAASAAAVIGPAHWSEAEKAARRSAMPDLMPVWHGGHMTAAWHFARFQDLFDPWYERSHRNVLQRPRVAGAEEIHRRTVDLLKAASVLSKALAAERNYDFVAKAAQLKSLAVVEPPYGPPVGSARMAMLRGGGVNARYADGSADLISVLMKLFPA